MFVPPRPPLTPTPADEAELGRRAWSRSEQELTDWRIQVNERQTYHVHRVMVGAGPRGSLRMRREFGGRSPLGKDATTTLTLPDECAAVVPAVLDFMYGDGDEEPATDDASQLAPMLEVAHQLLMPALVAALERRTAALVNRDSALECLRAGVRLRHASVANAAGLVVATTLRERPPEAYAVLEPDTLLALLRSEPARALGRSTALFSHIVTAFLRRWPANPAPLLAAVPVVASEDALFLLSLAVRFEEPAAVDRCVSTIAMDFAHMRLADVPSVPVDVLVDLLSRDELMVHKEDAVLAAVVEALREGRAEGSSDGRRALACCPRYTHVSVEAFERAVELLPTDVALAASRAILQGDRAREWARGRDLPFRLDARTGPLVELPMSGPGVLEFLGTDPETGAWSNPMDTGSVIVTASSVALGPASKLLGSPSGAPFMTADQRGSWVAVDLGAGRALRPTHFRLRVFHDICPLSFDVEASADGEVWGATLLQHRAAASTTELDQTWALSVQDRQDGGLRWQHFRVRQVGENAAGTHVLGLFGMDLWGVMYGRV